MAAKESEEGIKVYVVIKVKHGNLCFFICLFVLIFIMEIFVVMELVCAWL